MRQYDFIFSNSLHYRIARHAAFLFASWLFYLVTFYIPLGVFPAWNTEQFATASARLGFPTWLKLRLFNATMVFLPLIPFAYLLMYFVLPRFFFNKKNLAFTIAATAIIIAGILPLNYLAGWIVDWNNHRMFPSRRLRPPDERIWLVLKGVVFNYPIIGGFAVIIKMMKWGWLKQQETLQIAREKAGAELQLLKAQIHPHFLFFTLFKPICPLCCDSFVSSGRLLLNKKQRYGPSIVMPSRTQGFSSILLVPCLKLFSTRGISNKGGMVLLW